jgi:hypothetical protein
MVKIQTQSLFDKVLVSVISGAILSIAGISFSTYLEIKSLRSDLTYLSKQTSELSADIRAIDNRVDRIEIELAKK